MTRTIDERNVADKLHSGVATRALTGRVVFLVGAIGPIAARARASLVFALVNLQPCLRHAQSEQTWPVNDAEQRE